MKEMRGADVTGKIGGKSWREKPLAFLAVGVDLWVNGFCGGGVCGESSHKS